MDHLHANMAIWQYGGNCRWSFDLVDLGSDTNLPAPSLPGISTPQVDLQLRAVLPSQGREGGLPLDVLH